jgi:hypothetical protein
LEYNDNKFNEADSTELYFSGLICMLQLIDVKILYKFKTIYPLVLLLGNRKAIVLIVLFLPTIKIATPYE